MSEMSRVHIFVSGRVQGVFFRQNTQKQAKRIGINGWVRNLPDGRVEAIFEGEKNKVEEMINWAKKGPFFACVDKIDITWEVYKGEFNDFKIRFNSF